jgi:glycine oxidase
MSHVAIIGCGIIGSAIAYELSLVSGLKITVLDRKPPAQESTGAALGVLMGAISKKVKGRSWKLRYQSMQRYDTLIPELEANTGLKIPYNRQGIVMLSFVGEELTSWEALKATRKTQGFELEFWDKSQLQVKCPQLQNEKIVAAIYSPQDRQVNPTSLTQALVTAAKGNGVTFKFGEAVEVIPSKITDDCSLRSCHQIATNIETLDIDWLVIASGLGSTPLTASLQQSIDIKPVLGQALHLQLDSPLGNPEFQPVITGDDVHIVPVGKEEYWVGATVEFPDALGQVVAESALLEKVKQQAIAFCPTLAEAKIIRTWSGKRPRPEGQSAPVIEKLSGYNNVLLATGHYRNGVLLAPATAEAIRDLIRPMI